MFQQNLVDNKGSPIILSKELGRGGEGAVYFIQNNPSLVIKIYSKNPDQEKIDKIFAMIGMGNEKLLKLATWPINTVHGKDNKLIGFTMPKLVDHKPISNLYSPKQRLQEFPKADWRFLIHAAINTAKAFSIVHEAGQVIGDVNHANLLVAHDATVKLIDTDSFQIHFKGKYWFCEVGVSTHQPPEMQNQSSYKGIIRTPNHDNFGLAVLIFQLLCLGRHPFAGMYSGAGDMPLEKAILEYRYAYAFDSTLTKMSPPPATLPISALTPTLRLYFERAFSKESEKFGFRPSPQDWITALTELSSKLKQCSVNQSHHFSAEVNNCPWCDIETKCNASFFPITGPKSGTDLNITSLWQQFLNIKAPTSIHTLPDMASLQGSPSSAAIQIGKKLRKNQYRFTLLFLAIGVGCYGIIGSLTPIIGLIGPCTFIAFFLLYNGRKRKLIEAISQELGLVKPLWESLCLQHETLTKNYSFEFLRNQINELKNKYDMISNERENRFKNLLQNRFQQQLKQHLDSCRIATANIDGIGQGRIATLQSYSIETAADVDATKLMGISGFGRVLVSRLIDWKKTCENRFTFDSKKGVSQMDVAALDQDIAAKRRTVEVELSIKISQLSLLSKEISASRKKLQDQIYEILPKYTQALVNAREVGFRI